MLKRLNGSNVINRQVQNNVGLTMGPLVRNPNVNVSQGNVIQSELREQLPLSVHSSVAGSGVSVSQSRVSTSMSRSLEQANAIQFGSGKQNLNVRGLNKYSDMSSSKLHNEIRDPLSVSGCGDELSEGVSLGKAKLPGEILKRKLLLKMLKEKDKSKNAGGYSGGVSSGSGLLGRELQKKGGSINIEGTSDGKSRSKDLGDSYQLLGSGHPFDLKTLMSELSKINKSKIKLSSLPQSVQLTIKKSFDKMKSEPTTEKILKLYNKLLE